MATKTRKKRPAVAAKPDTRETISPLDESLPKQPASLEGQKPLPMMHGRTLRQCVRICRLVVSCNERILQGLPKRFHVWKAA